MPPPWIKLPASPEYPIALVIYGPPATKLRARAGRGGHYTDSKTVAAEERIVTAMRMTHRGIKPDATHAFTVKLRFFLPDYKRADIDNLEKLCLDSLNGVIWHDDQQVLRMRSDVYRGVEVPGTEISIGYLDREWRRATRR